MVRDGRKQTCFTARPRHEGRAARHLDHASGRHRQPQADRVAGQGAAQAVGAGRLNLLPYSVGEILQEELEKERRPNDFLLHASSHLEGSLRHAQLEVAGAPKVRDSFVRGVPLWIGSLIHEDIHRMLRKTGVPYMAEVNMTPWLPEGWGGTADGFFWNPDLKAFVLLDFKTTKGAGMRYIESGGAKEAHIKQTSAYWHAAKKMGLPLVKKIGVVYIPKDEAKDVEGPLLVDFDPIPVTELKREMKHRHGRVSEYVADLENYTSGRMTPDRLDGYLRDSLEPAPEREQRLYFDRPTGTYELKLVAPWYAAYCPFPDELCSCHEIVGKTTKIGYYDLDGEYYSRPGYEEIEPVVAPK
jgi:hypothetical protein